MPDEYQGIPDKAFRDAHDLLRLSPGMAKELAKTAALDPEVEPALNEITRNRDPRDKNIRGAYAAVRFSSNENEGVEV